ncbi:MAG: hypothetical protein QXI16_03165 [Sulfolobaceae archaeon]
MSTNLFYILESMFNALIKFTSIIQTIFSYTFTIDMSKASNIINGILNRGITFINGALQLVGAEQLNYLNMDLGILSITTIEILGGGLLLAVLTIAIIKSLNPV